MASGKVIVPVSLVAVALAAVFGFIAIGQAQEPAKPDKPVVQAEQPEFQLPPGWTEADAQACMLAGTPGKMHEWLVSQAGTWKCKGTMWMFPGAEAVSFDLGCTISAIMGGRFTQAQWSGEIPGMDPYKGLQFTGYDNMKQKFTGVWIENVNTAMLAGEGELSDDGKTLTWKFNTTCPINKKPVVMRFEMTRAKGETHSHEEKK